MSDPIYTTQFGDDEPINVAEWAGLTYLISPSEIPDVWVGHCLEVDIVSQGTAETGAAGALQMTLEATAIIIELDKREGRDPFERIAPENYWPPDLFQHWKKIRAMRGAQATWKGYDPHTQSFTEDAEQENDDGEEDVTG